MLISDALDLFRKGKELADAETWKNRTVAANTIAAFVAAALAVAKALGYPVDIGQDTVENLGVGVVAIVGLVNAVMHVVTSKRIGLPAVDEAGGNADRGSEGH